MMLWREFRFIPFQKGSSHNTSFTQRESRRRESGGPRRGGGEGYSADLSDCPGVAAPAPQVRHSILCEGSDEKPAVREDSETTRGNRKGGKEMEWEIRKGWIHPENEEIWATAPTECPDRIPSVTFRPSAVPLPLGNFSGRTSPRSSVIRRQECERHAVPGPSSCPSVFVDVLFGGVFLPSVL